MNQFLSGTPTVTVLEMKNARGLHEEWLFKE